SRRGKLGRGKRDTAGTGGRPPVVGRDRRRKAGRLSATLSEPNRSRVGSAAPRYAPAAEPPLLGPDRRMRQQPQVAGREATVPKLMPFRFRPHAAAPMQL